MPDSSLVDAVYTIKVTGTGELVGLAQGKTGRPSRRTFTKNNAGNYVAETKIVPGEIYLLYWQVFGEAGAKFTISIKRAGKSATTIVKDWKLDEPDPQEPIFIDTQIRGGGLRAFVAP